MKTLTFNKAKESFYLMAQVEGRSKETLKLYDYVLNRFQQFLEDKPLEQIEANDIRQYLFQLSDKGYSKSTVYTHHKELSALFRFLASEGAITSNPMENIKAPTLPKEFPYALAEEEIAKLLRTTKGNTFTAKRNYAIICLLLDSGMRASELTSLKLDDLNLAACQATVKGKGQKTRTVLFGKKCAKALSAYLKARSFIPYEDCLFVTQEGNPLNRVSHRRTLARLAEKAGLQDKKVCPHTLRHTFATFYIKRGGNPFVLQRLLGHSDIKTVMIYVNLVGRDLREDYFRHSP